MEQPISDLLPRLSSVPPRGELRHKLCETCSASQQMECWQEARGPRTLLVGLDATIATSLRREFIDATLVTNVNAARAAMEQTEFDLIVIDAGMGQAGVELLTTSWQRDPTIIRMWIGDTSDRGLMAQVLNAPCHCRVLVKPLAVEVLAENIRAAVSSRTFRSAELQGLAQATKHRELLASLRATINAHAAEAGSEPSRPSAPPSDPPIKRIASIDDERLGRLTHRERQLVQLLAGGKHVKDIAQELGISVSTARNHVQSVLRKLNVHSQIELLAKLPNK